MYLTTPRLALREFHYKDFEALHALYSNPVYQRYESPVFSKEKTRERLEEFLGDAKKEPRYHYWLAITVPPDDSLIGKIVLRLNTPSIREWEIGWGIHPACWGMGYAPEAARKLLEFGFNRLGAHRVMAICHAENNASTRVMEKIGMLREGRLRETRYLDGQWWDEYVYGILEKEYEGEG